MVNQIIDQPTLKYTTPTAAATKVKNVNAAVTIIGATVSGTAAAVKQYGEVTADGTFDMGDVGSVGLNFGLSGLDSMASSLTFGIVDIDAEKVADDLEADAAKFVNGDSWAAGYLRDQDKPVCLRFGVALGSSAYILGENLVTGIADGVSSIASWTVNAVNFTASGGAAGGGR